MSKGLKEAAAAAGGFLLLALLLDPFREMPLHDDWAYAETVRLLVETGRLRISDWTSPTLVLQAAWGALFCLGGFSHSALRLSTVAAGAAAVGLFRDLLRLEGVPDDRARLATAALAASPLLLPLSLTFMTDVPFLALCLLSLRLSWRSLRGTGGLWACGGAAAAACLVRQNGVLLPVGLLLWLRSRGRLDRRSAAALLLPSIFALAAHAAWFHGIHGATWAWEVYNKRLSAAHLARPAILLRDALFRSGWLGLYVGLAAAPFALPAWFSKRTQAAGAWRGASANRKAAWAAWSALALLGGLFLFPPPDSWLGPLGLGPVLAVGRDGKAAGLLGAPLFWKGLGLLCAVSLTALVGARADLLAWAFGPMLAWLFAGGYFTDRYFLVFFPPALSAAARLPRARGGWAVCAVLAVFSWAGTLDDLNWNEALADGARRLAAEGVPEDRITASLGWTAERNYAREMEALRAEKPLASIDDADWLRRFQRKREGVVGFLREPPTLRFRRAGGIAYFSPLTLRRENVYLYRK